MIFVFIGVICARNPHSSQVASAVSSLGAGDIFLVPFHGALGLTGRSYRPRRLRRWHDARALRPNFLDAAEMGGAARLRAFLLVPHADDFGSRRSRDVLGLLRRDGPVNGPARPLITARPEPRLISSGPLSARPSSSPNADARAQVRQRREATKARFELALTHLTISSSMAAFIGADVRMLCGPGGASRKPKQLTDARESVDSCIDERRSLQVDVARLIGLFRSRALVAEILVLGTSSMSCGANRRSE